MCGRFEIHHNGAILKKLFNIAELTYELSASYNIAPTLEVPTIIQINKRKLGSIKWGLVPHWAPNNNEGAKLINARSETIDEKPSFKESFKKRRCVILASGFYEWKSGTSKGQPHYITLADKSPMAFAGIWDCWKHDNGENHFSCAIITMEASEDIADVHHRMPVVLNPACVDKWLDEAQVSKHNKEWLQKNATSSFQKEKVSKQVNKVSFNTPQCIEPVIEPTQTELF